MPKQRNHPHLHRRRGVPRSGFQLPTYNTFSRLGGFVPRYPPGWTPRQVPPRYLYLFGGLAAAIVAVMLLAVALVALFGGR
ncbi:MAG TPA: hypothetical protein VFU60_17330 [Ktedonobacterales bacterium]|jgi:hypothetical protein|nr:hypothetical protein [Ktedonobacterales bacterium]